MRLLLHKEQILVLTLIFTNCLEIFSSGPMNVHLSDHLPVHVIKKHEQVKSGS